METPAYKRRRMGDLLRSEAISGRPRCDTLELSTLPSPIPHAAIKSELLSLPGYRVHFYHDNRNVIYAQFKSLADAAIAKSTLDLHNMMEPTLNEVHINYAERSLNMSAFDLDARYGSMHLDNGSPSRALDDEDLPSANQPIPNADVPHYVYPHGDVPYQHERELGRGNYAIVDSVRTRHNLVSWHGYPPNLARKVVRVPKIQTVDDMMEEVRIVNKLRHQHIITVLETYEEERRKQWEKRTFGIIMHPIADCNLKELLEMIDARDESDEMFQDNFERWFGCLASGLAYIHSCRIRHKDIKPANILIKDEQVLFSDFGISKAIPAEDATTKTHGYPTQHTPMYCAPEVAAKAPRGRKADVFSLGCVFLEMLTVACGASLDTFAAFRGPEGQRSYHLNPDDLLVWIHYLLKQTRQWPHHISAMLHPDPTLRISSVDLKRWVACSRDYLPWLQGRGCPCLGNSPVGDFSTIMLHHYRLDLYWDEDLPNMLTWQHIDHSWLVTSRWSQEIRTELPTRLSDKFAPGLSRHGQWLWVHAESPFLPAPTALQSPGQDDWDKESDRWPSLDDIGNILYAKDPVLPYAISGLLEHQNVIDIEVQDLPIVDLESSAETLPDTLGRGRVEGRVCPEGFNCSKGGVDMAGLHLIKFERNPDFKAHMSHHTKRWRCDLPDCPNTRGFARKDQLDRHKRSVVHNGTAEHSYGHRDWASRADGVHIGSPEQTLVSTSPASTSSSPAVAALRSGFRAPIVHTPHELTLLNSSIHVIFEVLLESDDCALIETRISNNTFQSISDLTFEFAVMKGYSLALEPQSGRSLVPKQQCGITQTIRLHGVELSASHHVDVRWLASYLVDRERKGEYGMIAILGGSDPPKTVTHDLYTPSHDTGLLVDSALEYPDAMVQNLPLRWNDWRLQDPVMQYAIDRDPQNNDRMEIDDDERSSAARSGNSPKRSEQNIIPSLTEVFDTDESWSSRV